MSLAPYAAPAAADAAARLFHQFQQNEQFRAAFTNAAKGAAAYARKKYGMRKRQRVDTTSPSPTLQRCHDKQELVSLSPTGLQSYQIGASIVQGLQINNRIGQTIRLRGLHIEYEWSNTDTTTHVQYVRMLVVQQMDSNAHNIDLFRGESSANGIDYSLSAPKVRQITMPINSKKYRVIKERVWKILPSANVSVGRCHQIGKMFIPFNKVLTYESQTAAGTETTCRPNLQVLWFVENNKNDLTLSIESKVQFWEYFSAK